MYICKGRTVNFELGVVGTNVTHTREDIIKIGAASPIALERARIIPEHTISPEEGPATGSG